MVRNYQGLFKERNIYMKLFKRLSAIGVAIAISTTLSINAFAATKTALCVGVNYDNDLDLTTTGDFRTNASNAKKAYSQISDMTATLYYTPTNAGIKNHITDNVIFLNSHARYNRINFSYKNSSGNYVHVYVGTGTNYTSGNEYYIGLSSYNLSNVQLITFAGCKTADRDNANNNLVATAYSKGAKCAVGFTNTINSRITSGVGWLKTYNESLGSGDAVAIAINNASKAYPTSNLGSYVYLMGAGNSIASASTSEIMLLNGTQTTISADDFLSSHNSINNFMRSYDETFDENEYKYRVNIFDEANKTGIVIFNHYINDSIITNKAYVVYIENGYVVDVSRTNTDASVNENLIYEKAAAFISRPETYSLPISGEIIETDEHYEYDYNTNELRYVKTVFTIDELGDIVENATEYVI